MDGVIFFWYLLKLILIGFFVFNWICFNVVVNVVIGGFDYIVGVLVFLVGGGGVGVIYFVGEFDDLIE